MADASDRSLPATPRRREAARHSGAMPSAAAPAWAAAALTTILLGPAWLRATVPAAADVLRAVLPAPRPLQLVDVAPLALVMPTAGLVLAAAAAALAVRVLLDGVTWQPGRLAPDPARIDPLAGLGRIFAWRTLWTSLGHAVGLAVLVAVAGRVGWPLVAAAASSTPFDDPAMLLRAAWEPLVWLGGAVAAVAVVQWAIARRRFEAAIRMTPQEFAEESRGMQADPKVRLMHWQRGRRGPAPVRRSEPAPHSARDSHSGR